MFERYTEKARRVIFFARYEASQYGSHHIETEHLLLGVMREGRGLMRQFLGPDLDIDDIRSEIEKYITVRERISTSVEVPLSEDSKRVLNLAVEEAERLGTLHVGEEHLLLALLIVKKSRASRILEEKGVKLEAIRELVAKPRVVIKADLKPRIIEDGTAKLYKFLARLRSDNPGEMALLLAKNARIVDSSGVKWTGRDEIEKAAKRIFEAYSRQGVTSSVESVEEGPGHTLVASVLWENVMVEGQASKSAHRMTLVLVQESVNWVVIFLQATPVVATEIRTDFS